MTRIVFVDIETTGLDPDLHEVWEVAAVPPADEGEPVVWQLPVNPGKAEAKALEVGSFYDRYEIDLKERRNTWDEEQVYFRPFAQEFARLTHGAIIGGAAPAFDVKFLERLLRKWGACPGWSHRLLDVETYVAGTFGADIPVSLSDSAELVDLEVDREQQHSALYDALLARDVYDAARQVAR